MTSTAPAGRALGASAILLSIVSIAALDVATPDVNVSLLQVLPLTLCAISTTRRACFQLMALVVLLIYAAYFAKAALYGSDLRLPVLNYKLLNRTLAALMVCFLGVVMQVELFVKARGIAGHRSTMLGCFSVFVVLGLTATFTILDVLTPANINFAVLYPIPLVLVSCANSGRLLWTTAALLIICTALGFFISAFPTPDTAGVALTNRMLVAIQLVSLAVLLHRQLNTRPVAVALPSTA